MRGMPGPGDAATWGGRTYDPDPSCYRCLYGKPHPRGKCPIYDREQEDERTDDGAPEFYDITDGEIE